MKIRDGKTLSFPNARAQAQAQVGTVTQALFMVSSARRVTGCLHTLCDLRV